TWFRHRVPRRRVFLLRPPRPEEGRNQSGDLSVPPTPLLPSGWADRTAMHDSDVTANVSIPSVGDLSGRRIFIEDVYPVVDAGRFPVKRIAGEAIEVWADIFGDGHAVLAVELLSRPDAANKWSRAPMLPRQNDRWSGTFTPVKSGRYV